MPEVLPFFYFIFFNLPEVREGGLCTLDGGLFRRAAT